MKESCSFIAGALVLIAFVPYIIAVIRKTIQPAKASWVIWATLDLLTFAGMYAKDAINGQITGAVIGVWIVVIVVLKNGTSGWTKLDKFCLAGAVIGVILWKTSGDANFGTVTAQLVIVLGSIPTFVSSWNHPERENKLAWTLFWISCIFTLAAMPKWSIEDSTQPIAWTFIESMMMYILYIRKPKVVLA